MAKLRYHVRVIGWYNNSDTVEYTTIDCDGMEVCARGDYMFWEYVMDGKVKAVAHYPIRNTIISKIEEL